MPKQRKLPAKLRPVVAELRKLPGVLGVFWGMGRVDGRWEKEQSLCVHVRRKWDPPRSQRIQRTYAGCRTDVLAVGDVEYHAVLDTEDQVMASERTSSITALAKTKQGDVVALLSGHGTLRTASNGFEPGPWPANAAPWIHLIDDHTTQYAIELIDGDVNSALDFACGRLLEVPPHPVLLGHKMSPLPFTVRTQPLEVGASVYHHSSTRRRTMSGTVVHEQDGDLHDGMGVEIARPIVVKPNGGEPAFSIKGDSGSLVFDEDRSAVGFVVAGAASNLVSYLMPITHALQQRMDSYFPLFFRVKA